MTDADAVAPLRARMDALIASYTPPSFVMELFEQSVPKARALIAENGQLRRPSSASAMRLAAAAAVAVDGGDRSENDDAVAPHEAFVVTPRVATVLRARGNKIGDVLGHGKHGEAVRTRMHDHPLVIKTFKSVDAAIEEQVAHIEIYARMRERGVAGFMTVPIWAHPPYSIQTHAGKDAKTLRTCINEGALARPQRVAIGQDLATFLFNLHLCGAVHGDLSASNLMVVFDDPARPRLKVVDFGLARLSAKAIVPLCTFEAVSEVCARSSVSNARWDACWLVPLSALDPDLYDLANHKAMRGILEWDTHGIMRTYDAGIASAAKVRPSSRTPPSTLAHGRADSHMSKRFENESSFERRVRPREI